MLFSPVPFGPLTLRNRSIRAAAFEGMSQGNGVSEQLIDYHESVAEGGIGMTTVAYAAIDRSGLSFPHQLWLRPEIVPDLRKLTDAVHKNGAAASIQIGHCGNMAKRSVTGSRPLSASTHLNWYGPTFPRAMNEAEIYNTVKAFGEAVRTARKAGFDAVEVHAGHGYLISQFLSPYTNHRKDQYGGSLENRMRFMEMVILEVMEAAEDKTAVFVKMNMQDGFAGGMTIDESLKVAVKLESLGVHGLVLSGGFVSRAPMYVLRGAMPIKTLAQHTGNKLMGLFVRLFGGAMVPEVPFREMYFLEDARLFRSRLKIPLVYVGGILSEENIEQVLGEGFDAVAIARALIRDPDFIKKLEYKHLRHSACDTCNHCIAVMYDGPFSCIQTHPHG